MFYIKLLYLLMPYLVYTMNHFIKKFSAADNQLKMQESGAHH